jgi:hypothetical protein
MSMSRTAGIVLPGYDPLRVANAPIIGTATATSGTSVSVAFTAPSCVGGGAISSYRAYAACGVLANTGSSSPIVVSGLTTGTAYTFRVVATNVYGPSYPSAASNSVTPPFITCAIYTTIGTYSWVAPAGVTSVAAVAIGGGGGGWFNCPNLTSGGGGGLGYRNNISVTPGTSYTVVVGGTGNFDSNGGQSSFICSAIVAGNGGLKGSSGGTFVGAGGGNGGAGASVSNPTGTGSGSFGSVSGGGAGGYSGAGGAGAASSGAGAAGTAGSGGGGGGGFAIAAACISGTCFGPGAGGGTGLFGQGSNGAAGTSTVGFRGGRGGSGGGDGGCKCACYGLAGRGGLYGGGGMFWRYNSFGTNGNKPSGGAVRIVWCVCGSRGTPSFPSTNVGAL